MKLELNHIQRINLYALIGAQRGDVATIRALWAIQDRLALTIEEETAIELRREIVAGQEHVVWNPARSLPAKKFDVTEAERTRIRVAVETWDGYGVSADRRWLEPLIASITEILPEP